MPESAPVKVIPVAVTVFPAAAFLSENVAVPDAVKESPEIRVSWYVTDAVSVPSYVLEDAVMLMVTERRVMSAVVVGAPEIESV